MANDSITIVNAETGEITVREMTDAEQAIRNAEVNAWETEQQTKENEERAKATAKVDLLEKLGITEDEAKLLLS